MTFSEHLAKQLEQAPQRVTFNAQQKPVHEWHKEGSQKRSIR